MMLHSSIFNMFGRSPIRPLQQHMEKACECVRGLLPFFNAVLANKWDNASHQRNIIAELEQEADNLKRDLRLHMPKGLFLPVSRGDILEILTVQDKIANKAKDISGLILGRQLMLPQTIATDYIRFLERSIDAAAQAKKAIDELDELLETGFRGRELQVVEEMIVELDKIENDTDEIQVLVRRELFAIENTLPPINAMFLYKIIDWTGDLADNAQMVGGQLLLLLAH